MEAFQVILFQDKELQRKRLTEEKIKVFSEENLEEIEKYLVELDKN